MLIRRALREVVSEDDWLLWADVVEYVRRLYDVNNDRPDGQEFLMECHSVSRALVQCVPQLRCVDGILRGVGKENEEWKLQGCLHSWLVTPDGSIIDAYPVGFIYFYPVLIPVGHRYSPFGYELYEEDKSLTKQISNRQTYRRSLLLAKVMKPA